MFHYPNKEVAEAAMQEAIMKRYVHIESRMFINQHSAQNAEKNIAMAYCCPNKISSKINSSRC